MIELDIKDGKMIVDDQNNITASKNIANEIIGNVLKDDEETKINIEIKE